MVRRILTRVGYVSLGIVYAILGGLAVHAAALALAGATDRVRGFRAAFRYLLAHQNGPAVLAAVGCGLAAFTLGRALDALDRRAPTPARIFAAIDALAHLVLAWMAGALLLRLRRGANSARPALGWILEQPWGSGVLKVSGAVVGAIGAFQLWQGLTGRLRLKLSRRTLSKDAVVVATRVGRFGYAIRGVVTAIIGWFLFRVGRDFDPRKYRDLGGALEIIQGMRFGPVLLGIAGLGLASYGAYLALLGFFRRGI
jgi:Domain of Unknown Function (DUF1206)